MGAAVMSMQFAIPPAEGDWTSPNLFTAAAGYAIWRDGEDSPQYFTAFRPDRYGRPCTLPSHELGAGAGDDGWAKCVALCEQHQAEQGNSK
jgi:glycyl-tRNA synthetase alpha subunit